jgi:hypothetical protein
MFFRDKAALQADYAAGSLSLRDFLEEASRLPDSHCVTNQDGDEHESLDAEDEEQDQEGDESFDWPYDETDWKFSATDLQRKLKF